MTIPEELAPFVEMENPLQPLSLQEIIQLGVEIAEGALTVPIVRNFVAARTISPDAIAQLTYLYARAQGIYNVSEPADQRQIDLLYADPQAFLFPGEYPPEPEIEQVDLPGELAA